MLYVESEHPVTGLDTAISPGITTPVPGRVSNAGKRQEPRNTRTFQAVGAVTKSVGELDNVRYVRREIGVAKFPREYVAPLQSHNLISFTKCSFTTWSRSTIRERKVFACTASTAVKTPRPVAPGSYRRVPTVETEPIRTPSLVARIRGRRDGPTGYEFGSVLSESLLPLA